MRLLVRWVGLLPDLLGPVLGPVLPVSGSSPEHDRASGRERCIDAAARAACAGWRRELERRSRRALHVVHVERGLLVRRALHRPRRSASGRVDERGRRPAAGERLLRSGVLGGERLSRRLRVLDARLRPPVHPDRGEVRRSRRGDAGSVSLRDEREALPNPRDGRGRAGQASPRTRFTTARTSSSVMM